MICVWLSRDLRYQGLTYSVRRNHNDSYHMLSTLSLLSYSHSKWDKDCFYPAPQWDKKNGAALNHTAAFVKEGLCTVRAFLSISWASAELEICRHLLSSSNQIDFLGHRGRWLSSLECQDEPTQLCRGTTQWEDWGLKILEWFPMQEIRQLSLRKWP